MQQINVEKIMEEIRAEIKEKGYTADMLGFEEIPLPAETDSPQNGQPAMDAVSNMRHTAFIAWRRPVNRGIKGVVKKALYKLAGFIAAPMAEDQTAFNSASVSAAEQICAMMERQQKELAEQKDTIETLKKHILKLEKRNTGRRRNV